MIARPFFDYNDLKLQSHSPDLIVVFHGYVSGFARNTEF